MVSVGGRFDVDLRWLISAKRFVRDTFPVERPPITQGIAFIAFLIELALAILGWFFFMRVI